MRNRTKVSWFQEKTAKVPPKHDDVKHTYSKNTQTVRIHLDTRSLFGMFALRNSLEKVVIISVRDYIWMSVTDHVRIVFVLFNVL